MEAVRHGWNRPEATEPGSAAGSAAAAVSIAGSQRQQHHLANLVVGH